LSIPVHSGGGPWWPPSAIPLFWLLAREGKRKTLLLLLREEEAADADRRRREDDTIDSDMAAESDFWTRTLSDVATDCSTEDRVFQNNTLKSTLSTSTVM
jgi:hypothetical protein